MSLLDKLFSKFTWVDIKNNDSFVEPYYCPDCFYIWEDFNNYLKHLKYCGDKSSVEYVAGTKKLLKFDPNTGKDGIPKERCDEKIIGGFQDGQFCLRKITNIESTKCLHHSEKN